MEIDGVAVAVHGTKQKRSTHILDSNLSI